MVFPTLADRVASSTALCTKKIYTSSYVDLKLALFKDLYVVLLSLTYRSSLTFSLLEVLATKAVRLPGELEDAPGTKKYVFRTLDEAKAKWNEACLTGEVVKMGM
jgi:hypothetical protein